MEHLMSVRGKRLYAEALGSPEAPALLYLHGGPGTGSYDFALLQGEKLSRDFFLILLDQRGVLRSDCIEENEPFGFDDLLTDCEEIRKELGLKRWSVLGHSFGGYIGVHYAAAFPNYVESLVLESPSIDLRLSALSIFRKMIEEGKKAGNDIFASECEDLLRANLPAAPLWNELIRMLTAMDETRSNLYVYGAEKDFFEKIVASAPFPVEWWEKASSYQNKLQVEGKIFESAVPLLHQITCPALLIKGKYDPVASDDQVEAFAQNVPNHQILFFEQSAHFPHFEEAELFAQSVKRFLQES